MIPAIEGLLPQPHDENIRKLLLAAVELHSLAKLRLHTEVTLAELASALSKYGALIREFATKTCPCFRTTKTPQELEAAGRRKAKKAAKTQSTGQAGPSNARSVKGDNIDNDIEVYYSLTRIKLHVLDDWLSNIRSNGTLEGFSSLRVCCLDFSHLVYNK